MDGFPGAVELDAAGVFGGEGEDEGGAGLFEGGEGIGEGLVMIVGCVMVCIVCFVLWVAHCRWDMVLVIIYRYV